VVSQRLQKKRFAGSSKALAKGFHALDVVNDVDAECAICANEFEVGEDDRRHGPVITFCEHVFARDCIVKWLWTHDSCPMCRRKLI
jgi:hypothetical protein